MNKIIYIILIILASCSNIKDLFPEKSAAKLQGKRIYLTKPLFNDKLIEESTDNKITITESSMNHQWTNNIEDIIPENIQLNNNYQKTILKFKNSFNFDKYSAPSILVSENKIFVKDSLKLTAYNKNDPKKPIWQKYINATSMKKSLPQGGMIYKNDRIYLTAGHREVIAINTNNGKEIWRYSLNNISRASPVIYEDKLFVSTIDNRLYALDINTGVTVWRYEGAGEDIGLFSYPSVAVSNQIVLVPHSSGQLHALKASNGEEIWSVNLSYNKTNLEGFIFTDISATPIIKNDIIYIAGNMGLLYAIDIYNGHFIWQKDIKNTKSLWINGNFIYNINENMEINALSAVDGKTIWIKDLKNNKGKNKILYGPIMANDKILVSSNTGELIFVSPYDGEIIDIKKINASFISGPIIVENNMYIFNNNHSLAIFK